MNVPGIKLDADVAFEVCLDEAPSNHHKNCARTLEGSGSILLADRLPTNQM